MAGPDLNFGDVRFVKSVYSPGQLPPPEFPEIAFAGRSNVGKSSLINRLTGRRSLVKVSARPGKTQSLNFFLARSLYLVDLPGYGFARVPKSLQQDWQELITGYLASRPTLCCTVTIVDLRHEPKAIDLELISWLRGRGLPFLPVYTKADKLSRNQRQKQAALLDAGFGIRPPDRVIFSARTGEGREELVAALGRHVAATTCPAEKT